MKSMNVVPWSSSKDVWYLSWSWFWISSNRSLSSSFSLSEEQVGRDRVLCISRLLEEARLKCAKLLSHNKTHLAYSCKIKQLYCKTLLVYLIAESAKTGLLWQRVNWSSLSLMLKVNSGARRHIKIQLQHSTHQSGTNTGKQIVDSNVIHSYQSCRPTCLLRLRSDTCSHLWI